MLIILDINYDLFSLRVLETKSELMNQVKIKCSGGKHDPLYTQANPCVGVTPKRRGAAHPCV